MKKILSGFVILFSISATAQNVGINNSNPQAALDINGGFRTRAEQVAVVNGLVNIPDNKSMIWITGNPGQPFAIIAPASYNQDGTRVIIYNSTAITGSINPESIKPGELVELIYLSATGWKVINKTPPPSTAFTHYIGEQFGGGVVVAVWKTSGVEHGLIVSSADVGTSDYSNVWNVIIGSTAQSRSNGQGNTTAIVNQPGHTNSAAKLCDDYTGGGFTDWYLPATWEMQHVINSAQIINEVLGVANGIDEGQFSEYWCSTEYITSSGGLPQGFGSYVTFVTASIGANAKTPVLKVRAMRRF